MRRAADELLCLTPAAIREFRPRPLHELAAEAGARRASEVAPAAGRAEPGGATAAAPRGLGAAHGRRGARGRS